MLIKKIILLITISSISNLSYADEGAYVSANIGFANIANWWTGTMAVTLNGGYNFNKYFATEAGGTWLMPISSNYPKSSGLSGSYSQSQDFIDIAAKGLVPFSNIFNLYGKLGIGAAFNSNSASVSNYKWTRPGDGVSPGIYIALGGELNINRHFDLFAEDYGLAVLGGNNSGNINVFGAGIKYKF